MQICPCLLGKYSTHTFNCSIQIRASLLHFLWCRCPFFLLSMIYLRSNLLRRPVSLSQQPCLLIPLGATSRERGFVFNQDDAEFSAFLKWVGDLQFHFEEFIAWGFAFECALLTKWYISVKTAENSRRTLKLRMDRINKQDIENDWRECYTIIQKLNFGQNSAMGRGREGEGKGPDWNSEWQLCIDPCTKCYFIWGGSRGAGLLTERAQGPPVPSGYAHHVLSCTFHFFRSWVCIW